MSGGSYNYAYEKVKYFIEELEHRSDFEAQPLRLAFALHLEKVAQAMHDIEWVDSCDYGEGDEDEAINACLSRRSKSWYEKAKPHDVIEIKNTQGNWHKVIYLGYYIDQHDRVFIKYLPPKPYGPSSEYVDNCRPFKEVE